MRAVRNTVLAVGAIAVVLLSAFCGIVVANGSDLGEPISGTAGPLTWTIEGGFTLHVSGAGAVPTYSSSANQPWAQYSETIHDIVIDEGVTQIGKYAFSDMPNVTSVSLPDSLVSILDNVFQNDTSLEEIIISDSVTTLGRYCFDGCSSLERVWIGDGATYVARYLFNNCSSLTDVHIGSSAASVGNYTFCNCTSLETIDIPSNVTSIGTYAFYGCTNLSEVALHEGLLEIQSYAFASSGITHIEIPDSCTEVWQNCFRDCSSLVSVKYPVDITYVGVSCFLNCTSLESIEFGDSVTEIRDTAFQGCSSLSDCWLPESLQTIGKSSFKNCSSLTEAIFYENVTSIGQYAYQNTGLTSVTVGSNVSSIGNGCFNGCNIPEVRNASTLDLEAGAITYGSIARNCQEIEIVDPYTVDYNDRGDTIATQTAYSSTDELTFRIRPADPVRDDYAFLGWEYDSLDGRYDTVTLPVDDATLEARWATLTITVTADGQSTLTDSPITFTITVEAEGIMSYSCSTEIGSASINETTITYDPGETDSTVESEITVTIGNGYTSVAVPITVLVDPVLIFINSSEEGIISEAIE